MTSSPATLHALFEQQARDYPGASALTWDTQHITYGQLNQEANHLAHRLRKLGACPETPIGICLHRGPELIVGILAILKSGAAYLPLDPTAPALRLTHAMEQSSAPILVTSTEARFNLRDRQATTLCIDQERESLAHECDDNPESWSISDNAAYVIYTSGSTGTPKGVVITHKNVIRLFDATHHWFNFSREDVWTAFHSHTFDFSVWELWGALLYGGRLVIVPRWMKASPEALASLVRAQGVTVLNQTPSAFRALSSAAEQEGFDCTATLRLVIFGGEALDMTSLRTWFARHNDHHPILVNMYGITETTVHVSYQRIIAPMARSTASLIGTGIPDLQIYLLDDAMEPVSVGATGEIYIAGPGLARGYLKRSDLTSERFLPNPFGTSPGERVYRSGDLARFTPDGSLEYIGRRDHQVKIRGHRIELGEIESQLNTNSNVDRAVVLAVENGTAGARLVAFVTPASHATISPLSLRRYLATRLPAYMIPSTFVALDSFPLTANEKVDRKALLQLSTIPRTAPHNRSSV
jgi:amino acid adenylation domain-containing protein